MPPLNKQTRGWVLLSLIVLCQLVTETGSQEAANGKLITYDGNLFHSCYSLGVPDSSVCLWVTFYWTA